MRLEVLYALSLYIMFIGFVMIFSSRNLIKIILGLDLLESGVNLIFVVFGYSFDFRYVDNDGFIHFGKTMDPVYTMDLLAKLKSGVASQGELTKYFVDPLPQALILTSIVIGVATLSLLLALTLRVYRKFGTLDIDRIRELKG